MPSKSYSETQILCGLRNLWHEEFCPSKPFDAEALIDDIVGSDPLPLLWAVERSFGILLPRDKWFDADAKSAEDREEEVAPRLTFRSFAKWIADHAQVVSLAPVQILGRTCATAGAFRGIEQLTRHLRPHLDAFGPSTPLRRRLGNLELITLWNHLRWISKNALPSLRDLGGRDVLTLQGLTCLSAVISLALLLIVQGGDLTANLAIVLLCWLLDQQFVRRVNPLPSGITTFGDLARLVAFCRE